MNSVPATNRSDPAVGAPNVPAPAVEVPIARPAPGTGTGDPAGAPGDRAAPTRPGTSDDGARPDPRWTGGDLVGYATRLSRITALHALSALEWWRRIPERAGAATGAPDPRALADPAAWAAYWIDRTQRTWLYADALRRRGNDFVEHEEGASRVVLAFEHEPVIDGRTLARPVNYALVRILPPAGWLRREDGRPYLIIDPRAGNGSGIGGFKDESEVGCALRAGHPVYFAVFTRDPVPGQTLADVCRAEAEFVREVRRRHPDAPKPVIVGNCQGGWAAMLLAATHPDVTGPVVANGAPLSYWSGRVGRNAMRYAGGWSGGGLPALWLSDVAGGRFDGAHLVLNFEASKSWPGTMPSTASFSTNSASAA